MWSRGPGTADTTETRMTLPTHSQTRNVLRTLPCHQGACRLLSDILDFRLFPQLTSRAVQVPLTGRWSLTQWDGGEREGLGATSETQKGQRDCHKKVPERGRDGAGQVPQR